MTDRCSVVSADLDEPLPGSAAVASAWLLLEDPGPWGREAIRECTIEAGVAASIADRADAAGVRVQMIRRPDRALTTPGQRVAYLAHSGPGEPWLRRIDVPEDALADLDPSLATRPVPPAGLGEPVEGDLLLACTHAKRDACCAQFGRPIAEAAAKKEPEATWETSHTGGHRFAGVLVVLPEGLTFGRLARRDVAGLVRGLQAGKLPLEHFRGRSSLPGAAQAAEVAVREAAGVARRDGVRVLDVDADGGANVVSLDVHGARWRAVVASRPLGVLRAVSCGGTPEDRVVHEVISVAEAGAVTTIRT